MGECAPTSPLPGDLQLGLAGCGTTAEGLSWVQETHTMLNIETFPWPNLTRSLTPESRVPPLGIGEGPHGRTGRPLLRGQGGLASVWDMSCPPPPLPRSGRWGEVMIPRARPSQPRPGCENTTEGLSQPQGMHTMLNVETFPRANPTHSLAPEFRVPHLGIREGPLGRTGRSLVRGLWGLICIPPPNICHPRRPRVG